MSVRSVLMIVVLLALIALVVVGRVRRRMHVQRLRHGTSSLFQGGDRHGRDADGPGHLASRGETPHPA